MWSWHWSPHTQTSLLLSPSDGLASFLKTTLANGVKVVKKVTTSKFRFHLIAIYALGCFRNFSCTPAPTKITLKSPSPRETSARINFNVIDKNTINLFFIKKKSQNVWDAIWTSDSNFLLAPKKKISGQPAGPHFTHWTGFRKCYHPLHMEKCWYNKNPRIPRFKLNCDDVEDETHFFLHC